ncbi:transmembrane protein 74B [Pangasianodon hypophthalmus]|uniref:transmembrane protein 74B n=1 Tax=Pangasianodon hypophthalmus TaxID=310915 RepID=UPI00147C4DDC|nr:transmembrane protein 74B [Pangasianodon hypophthalmus]
MECVNGVELHELRPSGHGIENTSFCDEEEEARVCVVNSRTNQHFPSHGGGGISPQILQGDVQSDKEQETVYEERSVDYSFMLALVFLVSGIALVVIAYAIPREAQINPDQVTARQMEKLEMYYAQLGSHLDKCIIAGLGLLTLGGMLLSILLMVSLCKGELYHRRSFAILRRPMKSYGSINMRMGQLASGNGREPIMECDSNTDPHDALSAERMQHLRQTQ